MKPTQFLFMAAVMFSLSFAEAQQAEQFAGSDREFLRPVSSQERSRTVDRHPIEMASLEYFASEGKFGLYQFDLKVLELKGEAITITPFNGPSIDIISHGIEPAGQEGSFVSKWTGEIIAPGRRETIPVELGITTWAITSDGELRRPDPNREITLEQLEQEDRVVLQESVSRLDEQIAYAVSGVISLPHLKRQITVMQVGDELSSVLLFEPDLEKAIPGVSDLDSELTDDSTTELGRERLRRIEAYEAHMRMVKRSLPEQE